MNHNAGEEKLIQLLNDQILSFSISDSSTYDALLENIGQARIVLLGEASHGTAEFYQVRAELSKRLITEKGFQAIAIEGDWTSAYQVDRYIKGYAKKEAVKNTLEEFKRFPEWMWRNTVMTSFLTWLREHNDQISSDKKVSFYGLDLYCLNESMQAVIDYLKKHDPQAAEEAMKRYACFDHLAVDPQTYGYMIEAKVKKACVSEVAEQFIQMQHISYNKIKNETTDENENLFYATQNARLVKNAENYYRSLFESRYSTWNIRDQHMVETVQNIIAHLETKLKTPAKIIIWAHNSHVGDARATEMSESHEVNLGQLVREKFNASSFHLGFSTYEGSVTAASDWGGKAKKKSIVPGMMGSYEVLFHKLKLKNFLLFLYSENELNHLLKLPRLQRAIGVIYRPDTERMSHYFFSRLPYQFDAIIHLDKTTAVEEAD